MHKVIKNLNLQFDILKEGKTYIAYCPALDLATHGKSITEAKKSFLEAARLFFETIVENGAPEEALSNLGWHIHGKSVTPPMIISRNTELVRVPVA